MPDSALLASSFGGVSRVTVMPDLSVYALVSFVIFTVMSVEENAAATFRAFNGWPRTWLG